MEKPTIQKFYARDEFGEPVLRMIVIENGLLTAMQEFDGQWRIYHLQLKSGRSVGSLEVDPATIEAVLLEMHSQMYGYKQPTAQLGGQSNGLDKTPMIQ